MSYGPTHARSRTVSSNIVKGVHFLMKKNKIEEVDGWGTITSATSMDVALNDGSSRSITFDNLIIGTGATVLQGVTIGDGAVVGANALVNKSLDEWTISGGIPARFLKERKREVVTEQGRKILETDPR